MSTFVDGLLKPDGTRRYCPNGQNKMKREHPMAVYLIVDIAERFVKIGRTYMVGRRLIECQTGSPLRLKVWRLFPGGAALEARLHERFKAAHLHGEWFHFTDEIRTWAEDQTTLHWPFMEKWYLRGGNHQKPVA